MSPHLLVAGATILIAMLATTPLILAHDRRNRRLAVRITERVTTLAPAVMPSRPLAEQLGFEALLGRWKIHLGGVLGYNLDRLNAYPLRLPFLLEIAAAVAAIIAQIVSRVAGLPFILLLPLAYVGCPPARD